MSCPDGVTLEIVDEIHDWHDTVARLQQWTSTNQPPQQASRSKIRIRFNRPLTWSERETFRDARDSDFDEEFRFGQQNELFLESALDSRTLYEEVAKFVEDSFVNLHPVAVKTFSESSVLSVRRVV